MRIAEARESECRVGGYGFALLCLPAVLAGVCCCVGLTWWGLRCEGRCEEGVCELL